MIQERTRARFTFPETTAQTRTNLRKSDSPISGLDQWIQQHPQAAFFGAVFLGVSLGWLLKTRKSQRTEQRPLGTNIASLVRDLARMADLQLQLLTLDIKQFWCSARTGITVSILAGIAILGSLPVLLFGIAGVLERATGWSPDVCRLALGTTISIVGIGVLWIAIIRVGQAAAAFKRSQEELAQNIKWVREVLHQEEV